MSVNIDLLREVVEWVEAENKKPEGERHWRQSTWFCGTACCVAGYIALKYKYVPYFNSSAGYCHIPGGDKLEYADDVAIRMLGIDRGNAEELFDGDNTAEEIREHAERIAGQKL